MKIVSLLCLVLIGLPAGAPSVANPLQDEAAQEIEAPIPVLGSWSARERLAHGIHQASLGRLELGLATLNAQVESPASGAVSDYLNRTKARLTQLIDSRDQLIRWAIDNKKRLRWPLDGKMVVIKPQSWKDGVLTIAKSSKFDFTEVSAQDLPMAFLAANYKKKSERFGAPWLEAYCLAMSANPAWSKAMPKDMPDKAAFLTDQESLPKFLKAGVVLAALDESSKGKQPSFEAVPPLAKSLVGSSWLAHRKPLLLHIARTTYMAHAKKKGLAGLLHGNIEDLGEGRIRLTYPFTNGSELSDFNEDPTWWSNQRVTITYDDEEEGEDEDVTEEASISEGELWLIGDHTLVHVLQFEGPMMIEANAHQEYDEYEFNFGTLSLGIHAAKPSHYVRNMYSTLNAQAGSRGKPRHKSPEGGGEPMELGKPFRVHMWTDSKKAYLEYGLNDMVEVKFVAKEPGTAIIWTQSRDGFGVDELILEGRPTKESQQKLSDLWLSKNLEALGLE
ncbi:MAG: hypothetical protein GY930_01800 [bacterium]|nr:hypothetical protein [bacterium]